MAKKLTLADLKVESFVTEGEKVTGGTDSINTGRICTNFALCGSVWECSDAKICVTDPAFC